MLQAIIIFASFIGRWGSVRCFVGSKFFGAKSEVTTIKLVLETESIGVEWCESTSLVGRLVRLPSKETVNVGGPRSGQTARLNALEKHAIAENTM